MPLFLNTSLCRVGNLRTRLQCHKTTMFRCLAGGKGISQTNKQSRSFCDCSVCADLFRLLRLVPFVGSSTP